jgi:hypothetical protein
VPELTAYSKGGALTLDESNIKRQKSMTGFWSMFLYTGIIFLTGKHNICY